MSRLENINDLIHRNLSNLVNQELKASGQLVSCLVTIIRVSCNQNLSSANVYVSVLPEKFSGTALKQLRKISGSLRAQLSKKIKLRLIPKLNWQIDQLERRAAEIERALMENPLEEI